MNWYKVKCVCVYIYMKVSAKWSKMQLKVGRNGLSFLKYSISAMFYSVVYFFYAAFFYLNPQSPISRVFCSMILLKPFSKISCFFMPKNPLAPTPTHKHSHTVQWQASPLWNYLQPKCPIIGPTQLSLHTWKGTHWGQHGTKFSLSLFSPSFHKLGTQCKKKT